jgi:D-proline reductase (dithiol) PrdB
MALAGRARRLWNQLVARRYARDHQLVREWAVSGDIETLRPMPLAEARKPLADGRLALVTTAGVHLRSQAPFDMFDTDGDATVRRVPADAAQADVAITHDYYDHREADHDLNVVLPFDRARELVDAGAVGSLSRTARSLMGHIDGRHVATLMEVTAPEIASELVEEEVDFALLTPA